MALQKEKLIMFNQEFEWETVNSSLIKFICQVIYEANSSDTVGYILDQDTSLGEEVWLKIISALVYPTPQHPDGFEASLTGYKWIFLTHLEEYKDTYSLFGIKYFKSDRYVSATYGTFLLFPHLLVND